MRTLQGLLLHALLKLRGLIVVPVYARLLGPEGLGVVTLAGAVCGLIGPVLILGLHTGMSVLLVHVTERERLGRVFATIFKFVCATVVFGVLVFESLLLSGYEVPLAEALRPYAAPLGLLLLTSSLKEVVLVVPQLRQETGYLTAIYLSMEYGGAILAVALALAGFGPGGVLWGLGAAVGLGIPLAFVRSVKACGYAPGMDWAFLRSAVAVGLPVLPVGIGQVALQALGAFCLASSHGQAAVGMYGLATTLSSIVMLVLAALNFVYFPTAVSLWYQGPERFVGFLERSFRLVVVALGPFVLGAWFVSPSLVVLLAGSRYAEAAGIVPIIVLGYSTLTVMVLLQVVPVVVERRMGAVAWCYAAMTLMNAALNLVFIPRWALKGAAMALLLSALTGVLLMGWVAHRLAPALNGRRSLLLGVAPLALTALLVVASPARPSARPLQAAGQTAAVIAAYLLVAHVTRSITPSDWRSVRTAVRGVFSGT